MTEGTYNAAAMRTFTTLAAALVVVTQLGCNKPMPTPAPTPTADLNPAAERYVKLVLALGEHDADYVDAFYGPPAWRDEVKAAKDLKLRWKGEQ